MAKNNYSPVLISFYKKHFAKSDENADLNNTLKELYFENTDEGKKALSVLNPLFDGESKNELFNNVKSAFSALVELFENGEEKDNISIPAILEKNKAINDSIKTYFENNKEYVKDDEYRAVMRLKLEMSSFSDELLAVSSLETSENRAENSVLQKIDENFKTLASDFLEEAKNRGLENFRIHGHEQFYSEKDSEAYKNKMMESITKDYHRLGYCQGRLTLYNVISNHYKLEKNYYDLVSPIYKGTQKRINELQKGSDSNVLSDNLNNQIHEMNTHYSGLSEQRRILLSHLNELNSDLANIKKEKNEAALIKSIEKKSKKKGEKALTSEEKNNLFYLKHANKKTLEDVVKNLENQYNEALNFKRDILDKVDENMEKYQDEVMESYTSYKLDEMKNEDIRKVQGGLNESYESIRNDRNGYKKGIENALLKYQEMLNNYQSFLVDYQANVSKYEKAEKEIQDNISILEAPQNNDRITNAVNSVKRNNYTNQIEDLYNRLDKVKSRTFRSNSTEFQNMFDKVSLIREKVTKNENNYKDSEEFFADMKDLKDLAVTYSRAKGKAVRSTTQGQERLDIAHEIISNYEKNEKLAENLSKASYVDMTEKAKELKERLENERKSFDEYCGYIDNEIHQRNSYEFADKKKYSLQEISEMIADNQKKIDSIKAEIKYHKDKMNYLAPDNPERFVTFTKDEANYEKESPNNPYLRFFPSDKFEKQFYDGYTNPEYTYDTSLKTQYRYYENKIDEDKYYFLLREKVKGDINVKNTNQKNPELTQLQESFVKKNIDEILDFQDTLAQKITQKLKGNLADEIVREHYPVKELEKDLKMDSNTKKTIRVSPISKEKEDVIVKKK